MELVDYLGSPEPDDDGIIARFLKKDLKKRTDLRLRVEKFLEKVKTMRDLRPYFKSGHLAKVKDGLYEMRIPPVADGGVVRIYYCKDAGNPARLVLLDAELKHETETTRVETARMRMTEYRQGGGGRKEE